MRETAGPRVQDAVQATVVALRSPTGRSSAGSPEARASTARARIGLGELSAALRTDGARLDHPRLHTLFFTTADVLEALEQAFCDAEAHATRTPQETPTDAPSSSSAARAATDGTTRRGRPASAAPPVRTTH